MMSMEQEQDQGQHRYDAKKYRTPDGIPADIVMFTLAKQERKAATKSLPRFDLKVMLIRRRSWPFAGAWALPGDFHKRMSLCMRPRAES